jgi:hypothetical protein
MNNGKIEKYDNEEYRLEFPKVGDFIKWILSKPSESFMGDRAYAIFKPNAFELSDTDGTCVAILNITFDRDIEKGITEVMLHLNTNEHWYVDILISEVVIFDVKYSWIFDKKEYEVKETIIEI